MLDNAKVVKQGGGEEVFTAPQYGFKYTANMVVNDTIATRPWEDYFYRNCAELVSFETNMVGNGYAIGSLFRGCSKLKTLKFTGGFNSAAQTDMVDGCYALETIQLGSIGHKATKIDDGRIFRGQGSNNNLTITIFTDATAISDIPTGLTSNRPWGATLATIIYRNSTTGEVIEA